jgi:hypothetical protein
VLDDEGARSPRAAPPRISTCTSRRRSARGPEERPRVVFGHGLLQTPGTYFDDDLLPRPRRSRGRGGRRDGVARPEHGRHPDARSRSAQTSAGSPS